MPIVRKRSGFGMGQAQAGSSGALGTDIAAAWNQCPWYDVVCALQTLGTGTSDYESSLYPVTAPVLGPGSVSPGLPSGYSSATATGDIPSNAQGQTIPNAYTVTYPNLGPSSQPATPSPSCDWTQANWGDVTTWCAGNWLIVGIGAAALIAFAAAKGFK
jgi:hypothetical protein